MSESDAYIAGLFDGEGHVSAWLNGTQWTTALSIGQKYPEVLEFVLEVTDCGYIFQRKGGHYTWRVSNRDDILQVIRQVYPYSIIKRRRLKLAYGIAKLTGVRGPNLKDPTIGERRYRLAMEIRRLNHVQTS